MGRIARALPLALALAVLLSVAAGAVAKPTATHIYRAFRADGSPAVHVTRTLRGSCFTGSIAANRNDAWRCMSGNVLYDPCFSSGKSPGTVLCPLAPWLSSAVKLSLTRGLPLSAANKARPSTSSHPWGIRTGPGWECQFNTGTSNLIHGLASTYFCRSTANWLWGLPNRRSQPWTIFAARLDAKVLSLRVSVTDAWF